MKKLLLFSSVFINSISFAAYSMSYCPMPLYVNSPTTPWSTSTCTLNTTPWSSCTSSPSMFCSPQTLSHSNSCSLFQCAKERKFKKGDFIRLLNGPEDLKTTVLQVQGTSEDIWGVEDLAGWDGSLRIPAIRDYFRFKGTIGYGGTVYYVQDVHSGIKHCVHESWMVPEDNFTQEDKPAMITSETTKDGKRIKKYYTNADLDKKFEKKRAEDEKIPPLVRFKRDYIDTYYDTAKHGAAKKEKDLLIQYTPSELKQWFQDITDGKKPTPLLISGKSGVGKTMTPQALVSSIGATLCNMRMPEYMRHDWRDNRFEAKHLDKLEGTVCVMVGDIMRLASDDVENLHSLIDFCNARKNMHLFAIICSNPKSMPSALYNRFTPFEFPMPNMEKKLALLKNSIKCLECERDIDDEYLKEKLLRIPDCTARDAISLGSCAMRKRSIAKERQKPLSRDHFEQASNYLERNRQLLFGDDDTQQKKSGNDQSVSVQDSKFTQYAVLGTCAAVGIGGIAALTYLHTKNKK